MTKSSWHVGGNVAKILTVRAEGGLYDLFCGEETDQMSSKFRNCDDDDDEDYQLTRDLPCRSGMPQISVPLMMQKENQYGGVIQRGRENLLAEAAKNIIRKRVYYEVEIDESPSSEEYFSNQGQPSDLQQQNDVLCTSPRTAGSPQNTTKSIRRS